MTTWLVKTGDSYVVDSETLACVPVLDGRAVRFTEKSEADAAVRTMVGRGMKAEVVEAPPALTENERRVLDVIGSRSSPDWPALLTRDTDDFTLARSLEDLGLVRSHGNAMWRLTEEGQRAWRSDR